MTKKAANKVVKNWLEWIVFGVSLALVVGTLGYLLYDGATATEAPPSIQVRLGEQQRTPHNFIVHVAVTNDGGQTAEEVHVEVVLEGAGGETERGEFVVAFLPRRATREGWVAFRSDPAGGKLTSRVLGYEKP